MKSALALCLVAVAGLAFGTTAAPARPPAPAKAPGSPAAATAVRISGRDYVSIGSWAKANGFDARWLTRNKSLQLTTRSARILLNADAKGVISEAAIDGVLVKLLFPLVLRNGTAYMALLDAVTTLRPILHPPSNPSGVTIKSICLDPGHGGKDPGYQISGHNEKTYALLLAQELRDQLTRAGFKVSLTRTDDSAVDLAERPGLANQRKADLFVSLHFNACADAPASVRGAEVYCLTPAGAPSSNAAGQGSDTGSFIGNRNNDKNMFLAYELQKSLTKGQGVEDRGVHRSRFAVLKDPVMPAVLVESGYMSHPVEGKKIFDAAYRRQIAKGIVDGILAYKKAVEGKGT